MKSHTVYLTFNTKKRKEIVSMTKGRFDAGPWQRVFYCEFDGQRNKRVIVKVIGE